MRVCAVTPHLPPEQAANALLPCQLAEGLQPHGVDTVFVSHPPRGQSATASASDVTYVPRRQATVLARSPVGALMTAAAIARTARQAIMRADLVHLHGNGFIIEIAKALADRCRRPYVITLYGTDVWHHDRQRHRRFRRVIDDARHRVFYSQGLRRFADGLGIAPAPSSVIYAPVPPAFQPITEQERARLRADLTIGDGPLLLTVKRLHDVAAYDVLLAALTTVLATDRRARAWIAGDGQLRDTLEAQTQRLGLGSRVRFLGPVPNDQLRRYYAAADLFVLPSRLESWGTVMLEALACGTPVVATATAGGVEVHELFPQDVLLAPIEDPQALAATIAVALQRSDRVSAGTIATLRSEFSVEACAGRYFDVYRSVLDAA